MFTAIILKIRAESSPELVFSCSPALPRNSGWCWGCSAINYPSKGGHGWAQSILQPTPKCPRHRHSHNSPFSLEKEQKGTTPRVPARALSHILGLPPSSTHPPSCPQLPVCHCAAKNTGAGVFFTSPVIYLHTPWSCDSLEAVPCFVSSQR